MAETSGKKKILIINNNMHIGGVQKSLVNLLNELSKDPQLSITLLLLFRGGELLSDIPENVEVIEARSVFRLLGMTRNDTASLRDILLRGCAAAFTRAFGRDRLLKPFYKGAERPEAADIAISFLHSGDLHTFYGGCNEYLINCVDADKKVTFLHCDYESIHADSDFNTSLYERMDTIAACSEGCKNAFLRVLPQLSGKVAVVPNCHDYRRIRALAEQDAQALPRKGLNILTVARLGREKGILRAIRAVGSLGLPADSMRYYIIGTGSEYGAATGMIEDMKLEDRIFLMGEKENPCGYMKAAGLLLIPSYSEASPMVIQEAAALGTPVLSTRTISAEETITAKGIGLVCDNSEEGIREALLSLAEDPSVLSEISSVLKSLEFDNSEALERFYTSVLDL